MANWNSANAVIFYGKDGALVQTVLEIPEFHDLIGPDERRGLSPLFCSNINPYGRFRLDMDRRLDRTAANPPAPATVESVL